MNEGTQCWERMHAEESVSGCSGPHTRIRTSSVSLWIRAASENSPYATRLKVLAVCHLLCADSVAWGGRPRPPIVLSSTALRIPNGNLGRPSCPR